MSRWRMVSEQNGNLSVSTVVLGGEEAREHLEVEEDMHRMAGWNIERDDGLDGPVVVCTLPSRGIVRRLWVAEFTAMNDIQVDQSARADWPTKGE